jgi:hypothetical protein
MGQFTPQVKSELGFTDTAPLVKGILVLWLILLLPWLPLATLGAGMAFEGGVTWKAYVFVWSLWIYPVSTLIAYTARQKMPILALLPILNVAGTCISGF